MDYRKLLKDAIRGSYVECDYIPELQCNFSVDEKAVMISTEEELAAYRQLILEIKEEVLCDLKTWPARKRGECSKQQIHQRIEYEFNEALEKCR